MHDRIVARAGALRDATKKPRSWVQALAARRDWDTGTGSTQAASACGTGLATSGAARPENAVSGTDANHHCQQHIVAGKRFEQPDFRRALVRMGITSVSVRRTAPRSVAAAEADCCWNQLAVPDYLMPVSSAAGRDAAAYDARQVTSPTGGRPGDRGRRVALVEVFCPCATLGNRRY